MADGCDMRVHTYTEAIKWRLNIAKREFEIKNGLHLL